MGLKFAQQGLGAQTVKAPLLLVRPVRRFLLRRGIAFRPGSQTKLR